MSDMTYPNLLGIHIQEEYHHKIFGLERVVLEAYSGKRCMLAAF
jgi:hypothetical protein